MLPGPSHDHRGHGVVYDGMYLHPCDSAWLDVEELVDVTAAFAAVAW